MFKTQLHISDSKVVVIGTKSIDLVSVKRDLCRYDLGVSR